MEIKVIFHITGKSGEAKLLNPDFLKLFYRMQLVAGRDRKI